MGTKWSSINKDLALLNDYRYKVYRYIISHKELTIVAHPLIGEDIPVYITFVAVEYLQLPTKWESAPFQIAPDDEYIALMKNLELKRADDLHLYYAELPKTRINIICGMTAISDIKPSPETVL